jgi:hypothetical protein
LSSGSSANPTKPSVDIGLVEIFSLQDQAFQLHFLKSLDVGVYTTALSRLVGIAYHAMNKGTFAAEKQTVTRHFGGDSLSHLVVAVRVGLWGALPESLSVLRGGIESCAQLAYVVTEKRYGTAMYEAQTLGRFRQLDFERVCGELGDLGKKLRKLHSQISDAAGHSTVKRFSLLDYTFEGVEYDRLGVAFVANNAKLAAQHCVLLASLLVDCLRLAYVQDGVPFEWEQEFGDLLNIVESLPTSSNEPDTGAEQDG